MQLYKAAIVRNVQRNRATHDNLVEVAPRRSTRLTTPGGCARLTWEGGCAAGPSCANPSRFLFGGLPSRSCQPMSLLIELAQDLPHSPLVEAITRGQTVSDGGSVRPAESRWHLVLIRHQGKARAVVTGPWTTAGLSEWKEDAEIIWIRLKPGTFMPHLPFRTLVDRETALPAASSRSFWLKGSAWQVPDIEHLDVFLNRMAREELLVRDPVVRATLEEQTPLISPRTLRHRFLQATGLSHTALRQIERAQRAEALLRQGVSIADAVHREGYADQPHLTRALKQLVGYTPAQLVRLNQPQ